MLNLSIDWNLSKTTANSLFAVVFPDADHSAFPQKRGKTAVLLRSRESADRAVTGWKDVRSSQAPRGADCSKFAPDFRLRAADRRGCWCLRTPHAAGRLPLSGAGPRFLPERPPGVEHYPECERENKDNPSDGSSCNRQTGTDGCRHPASMYLKRIGS